MKRSGKLMMIGLTALAMQGCGGDDSGEMEPEQEPGAQIESHAPLCTDLVTDQAPNELFSHQLVDPSAIAGALPFGDMEPKAPQEVLNYELGFYLPDGSAALTAPGDLYIEAIERSFHPNSGITDWGLGYHVCSYQDGEVRRAAVYGNFAHITSLSAELAELFDTELQKLDDGLPSAMFCDEERTSCTLNFNAMRDLIEDPDYVLVAEAGSAIGVGGQVGGEGPAGIDTNLIDRRTGDFSGHYYINPERLGAEDGPGQAWRYAACTYEYFVEPYRSQYLDKIRFLGEPRVSAEAPCGTLEVDRDAAGTVGGLWVNSLMAGEKMEPEIGGAELDTYLSNMLVLADHINEPATRMMISTPIPALSQITQEPSVIEFDKSIADDADWAKLVNVPFKATEPGGLYCYAGNRLGGFEQVYFLAEVSGDGSTLTVQRVEDDCSDVPVGSRSFDAGADEYYVFVR